MVPGSCIAQEKQNAYLSAIIAKLNDLFEGDLYEVGGQLSMFSTNLYAVVTPPRLGQPSQGGLSRAFPRRTAFS
ncbi:hypothetical protein KKC22_20650, partial [Myxococcota bacterium]|nr:hypothetical protein [Myxococcota bacterium]